MSGVTTHTALYGSYRTSLSSSVTSIRLRMWPIGQVLWPTLHVWRGVYVFCHGSYFIWPLPSATKSRKAFSDPLGYAAGSCLPLQLHFGLMEWPNPFKGEFVSREPRLLPTVPYQLSQDLVSSKGSGRSPIPMETRLVAVSLLPQGVCACACVSVCTRASGRKKIIF